MSIWLLVEVGITEDVLPVLGSKYRGRELKDLHFDSVITSLRSQCWGCAGVLVMTLGYESFCDGTLL